MDPFTTGLTIVTLLGSALVSGTFFAFSGFVMKALARIPTAAGVAAMQEINIVVINPWFLGVFIGTAVLSLAVAAAGVLSWGSPAAPFQAGGAALYVVGTFLVTGVRNVPLNNELAVASSDDPATRELWRRYLREWTAWNHVRTVAGLAAALCLSLGLVAGTL